MITYLRYINRGTSIHTGRQRDTYKDTKKREITITNNKQTRKQVVRETFFFLTSLISVFFPTTPFLFLCVFPFFLFIFFYIYLFFITKCLVPQFFPLSSSFIQAYHHYSLITLVPSLRKIDQQLSDVSILHAHEITATKTTATDRQTHTRQ